MNNQYSTIQNKPVIVVGSEGRFGKWIYRLLQRCGARNIQGFDLGDGDALIGAAAEARVAVVCVPTPVAPAVARRLSGLMQDNSLIVDLSSLKTEVACALAGSPQDVLLVHPMCGPPAGDSLGDAAVALLRDDRIPDMRHAENIHWRDEFLAALGGRVVRRDVASHDLICRTLQTATHAALLGIGEQIVASGLRFQDFRELAPPVGAHVLDAIESHLGCGSADVFAWLQKLPGDLPAHENPTLQLAFSAIETARGSWNAQATASRWLEVSRRLFPARYS